MIDKKIQLCHLVCSSQMFPLEEVMEGWKYWNRHPDFISSLFHWFSKWWILFLCWVRLLSLIRLCTASYDMISGQEASRWNWYRISDCNPAFNPLSHDSVSLLFPWSQKGKNVVIIYIHGLLFMFQMHPGWNVSWPVNSNHHASLLWENECGLSTVKWCLYTFRMKE